MGFFSKLRRKLTGTGAPPTSLSATGDITTGLDLIKNISISTATIFEGCSVSGTGITGGTTVLKILNSNTVLISTNATATTAALPIVFGDLFKYGQIATDGASLYYASQTDTVNRALAATGALDESFDGIKTSSTWVRSGTNILGDTQPIQNNDLVRKDFVKTLINNSGKRQYIMGGRHMHHRADFIEVGTGLTATLKAAPAYPFIATCANGFEKTSAFSGAPSDLIIYKDTDTTFTNLYPRANNFLFGERNSSTGDLTPKSTVLAPVYDSYFTDDRGGKALFTFDGGTAGDKIAFNAFNNSFPDGGIDLLGGAQLDNSILFGASTTNLRLNQSGPVQYAKFNLEEKNGLQNDMHTEYCYETFFYATNAANGNNQFIFSNPALGLYLSPTGVLTLGVDNEKTGSIVSLLLPQPLGALAAHDGLGPISAAGVLSSAAWYHVAVTLDGLKMNVFVNGYMYAYTEYLDSSAPANGVFDAMLMLNPSGTPSTGTTIGVYSDGVSSPFDGHISYFSVKPYVKYYYNRYNYAAINSPIYFVPTLASVAADTVKTDRYFQQYDSESSGNVVMFNFDSTDPITGIHDYYNTTMRVIGGNETVGGPYVDTSDKKFGNSSLRLPAVYSGGFPTGNGYTNTALFNMPRLDNGNFTFEFWCKPNGAGDPGGLNVNSLTSMFFRNDPYLGNDAIRINANFSTNDLGVYFGHTIGGDIGNIGTTSGSGGIYAGTFTPGVWHHIAVTGRINTTNDGYIYSLFLDGNKIDDLASTLNLKLHDWGFFGAELLTPITPATQFLFRGWIDDVHCIQICKYTASFTPPAAANAPTDYGVTPVGTNIPGTYQYYYDIPTGIMYKGYSGNWNPTVGIFVGEAVTWQTGTKVEKTVSYSIGTKLKTLSRASTVPDNTSVSITHNFGTRKVRIYPRGRLRTSGTSFSRGYEFDIFSIYRSGTDLSLIPRVVAFRNSGILATMSDSGTPNTGISDTFLTVRAGSTNTLSISSGIRLTTLYFEVERLF